MRREELLPQGRFHFIRGYVGSKFFPPIVHQFYKCLVHDLLVQGRLGTAAGRSWYITSFGGHRGLLGAFCRSSLFCCGRRFTFENDHYHHIFGCQEAAISTQTWTVAEAEARFKAKSKGPQKITKHGRTTAVVVAVEDGTRKIQQKENLAEFLSASPLRASGLKVRRLPIRLREIEL